MICNDMYYDNERIGRSKAEEKRTPSITDFKPNKCRLSRKMRSNNQRREIFKDLIREVTVL